MLNQAGPSESTPLVTKTIPELPKLPDLILPPLLNKLTLVAQQCKIEAYKLKTPKSNYIKTIPSFIISLVAILLYIGPSIELGKTVAGIVKNLLGGLIL